MTSKAKAKAKAKKTTKINDYDRVKSIIGITEEELVKSDSPEKFIDRKALVFINEENNKQYPCGSFQTHTVSELRELVAGLEDQKTIECKFEVLEGIDIGAYRVNDKSMVQVASNFNCLEVPSRSYNIKSGFFVDKLHMDSTQGPAASFGPLAGALYRAHFIPEINLLKNVEQYLGESINGKITLNGNEELIQGDSLIDTISDNVMAGIHTGLQVLYNRSGEVDKPYGINQIFNASINLNDYGKRTSMNNLIKIMRSTLRATYESAILGAIANKCEYLYLTLVGGGVFGNPLEIILDELGRSYNKWANCKKSTLKCVYLCTYTKSETQKVNVILKKLIK